MTSVLWLNDNGLDIRCLEAKLYSISREYYVNVSKTIPLPSASAYRFSLRKAAEVAQNAAKRTQGPRIIPILVKAGVLKPGDSIKMIRPPGRGLSLAVPSNVISAKYVGGDKFKFLWELDDEECAISKLTEKVFLHLGGQGERQFQGPYYWALAEDSISLLDRAAKIVSEPPPSPSDDSDNP